MNDIDEISYKYVEKKMREKEKYKNLNNIDDLINQKKEFIK